jgi:hypothetical protein
MKLYICELRHEAIGFEKRCWKCYHAYPHKHKKNCNGNHCLMSNVYNQSEEMKGLLTCKLITDLKKDKTVINNVKFAKGTTGIFVPKERRKAMGLKD